MVKSYSYDLRTRVIAKIDEGFSAKEVSKMFNVSSKVIYDWQQRRRETGDIKAKTQYQRGHSHKIVDLYKFRRFLEDNAGKSSKELAQRWFEKISNRTILRSMKKLGLSYKKKPFITPKEMKR